MDNQNKEIDLIEVFKILLNKISKNSLIFISVVVLFVVFGLIYNYTQKEKLKYSTIAMSSLDDMVVLKYVNDLNSKISEDKNFIPKLEYVEIKYDDSEDEKNFFNINLIVNDSSNIRNTIKQITECMDNFSFIKNTINEKKEQINTRIKNYINEIKRIEDIQRLILSGSKSETTIISTNGLSREKIDFENSIIQLDEALKNTKSFEIISDNINIVSTKKVYLNMVVFIFLGLLIGSVIVIIKG